MANYSKQSTETLQRIKSALQDKIALLDAREAGDNAQLEAAFASTKATLQSRVTAIDAEIASR